jgi:putative tryptophan/tyrosine transport system substrate-binding protein
VAAAKLALLCWVLLTACQVVTPSSPPITRPVIPQLRDPAPLPRVAYLWAGPRPGSTRSLFDVFRDELPSYGWVDGQNVIVDSVSIDHQIERYPSAIAGIIASRPAVIVVGESVAAPMVKEATTEIPVVLTLGGNFVAAGQACSVNRPCGNITGLSLAFEPLSPKRAEMLKEMAPATQRLGFLRNGGIPETELELDALQRAAPALGLEIVPLQFRTPADFPSAFREATDHAIDGLVVMPDSLSVMHRAELLRFTSEHGLPDAYGVREHAVDGQV